MIYTQPAFYSIIITLSDQNAADKVFNAFNGRYFNDINANGEMMHTVFLSEVIFVAKPIDLDLLAYFGQKHKNTHFDRLPTCPSCLNKLDSSLSGL